jgi:hypothetical protein
MAKQVGIFPIEGALENVSFYKSEDGFMVRKKGGVSKDRIMNDPAYVRTRENLNQFGLNAKAGKIIRNAIPSLLKKGKDSRVSSRLSKLMGDIAKQDHVSVRGKKSVAIAAETPAALLLLKGFNFNNRANLQSVLDAPIDFDSATGVVRVLNFIPEENLTTPHGATHVGFRSGFASINFATAQTSTVYSPKVQVPIDLTMTDVILNPPSIPDTGAGQKRMIVLLVEFYQEVDGVLYPLSNGAFNSLSILDMA